MELLIPGLILVGLMVYASTRIKRNAAKAFEAETIETPEFTIRKAEGMLHVLNGDPRYAFEAYSKDFGTIGRRDIRLATATIEIVEKEPERADEQVVSDLNEVIGDHHYHITESSLINDGAEYRIFRKAAQIEAKTAVLEVRVLTEAREEFVHRLDAMIDSFSLK